MFKIIALIFIIVLVSLKFVSCTKVGLITLNTTSQLPKGFQREKNINYGDENRQQLDVYSPKVALNKPLPVVVFFYGGTWQSGTKNDYKFMAEALNSIGIVAVITDYRLYPEVKFPTFVEDGARAVKWVSQNIQKYNGDPKQIYVMGHSAGAHIAAMLALDSKFLGKPSPIAGLIGLAGPFDFLPIKDPTQRKIFAPEADFPKSQPINFASKDSPRTLLLHGLKDRTVGKHNSKNLAQKMRDHNVEVVEKYYEDLNHINIVAKFSRLLREKELLKVIKQFVFVDED